MSKPLVSVILTTCGREPLVQRSVESVLTQSRMGGDFELLIVCDGNKYSPQVYEKMLSNYLDRVHLVHYSRDFDAGRKRVAGMINAGLRRAKGEFITYLCDDDIWLPDRLDRLLTTAQLDADWAVDRVRWTRPDGVVVPHSSIGNFLYTEPLEVGHVELAKALSGLGSNWICHDCVVHRRTADRWPEVETHTPVDWRFWCSLWKRGLRPQVMTEVGAEAFYPGAWRAGLTIEQAVKARTFGGGKMTEVKTEVKTEVVQYAVNSGNQIETVQAGGGKCKSVPPGGRIDIRLVTTPSGEMFPAFTPEGRTSVPALLPKVNPDFVEGNDGPHVGQVFEPCEVGALVDDKPVVKKKPFRVTESKLSESKLKASELEVMFKSEILKLIPVSVKGASMSKTKNDLIKMYLDA